MIQPSLSRLALALLLSSSAALAQAAANNPFRDPLDAPARISASPQLSMFSDVARKADGGFVAVGRRGLILLSSDGGASWTQAKSPVSTDLLSLSFPDAKNGWAVGHGGVVLHTQDGGQSWERQIDGRSLPALVIALYKTAAEAGDETAKRNLEDAERYKAEGPGRPLLAVRFSDAQHGIAVGAYNLAIRTDDGGRSWRAIGDQLDNPRGMHLYGIAQAEGRLWIAGEQGVLMREESAGGRFTQVKTPYAGSFFGITARAGELVVYGLRGNALRSSDNGASWAALNTGTQSNLTAGTLLPDGRLLLAAMNGELLLWSAGANAPARLPRDKPVPEFGLAVHEGGVVMAGARGLSTLALQQTTTAQAAAR